MKSKLDELRDRKALLQSKLKEADRLIKSGSSGAYTVQTLGKVAEFFGVAVQTVKQWRMERSDPMPGVEGRYPLDEITRWKLARVDRFSPSTDGEKEKPADIVAKHRAELLAIEVEQRRGALIEVDIVERLISRHVAVHNTLADELKDKVLNLLPRTVTGEARKRVMKGVDKAVTDLRFEMATCAEANFAKLARKTARKAKR